MKRALLIGGGRAVEIVKVDDSMEFLRMPKIERIHSGTDFYGGQTQCMAEFKIEYYRKEVIVSGRNQIDVFVIEGSDPLVELLNGYNPVVWGCDGRNNHETNKILQTSKPGSHEKAK